jgi:hypothetical protein
LTVNLSEAVTVNTTGGTPTLALNDGGTANYIGGSGGTALTFSYTVATGQTTSDLAISALNLNGAVINDGAGNAANLSAATNYNPTGTLQVNPTTAARPSHIVVLSLENENYSDIVGNTQAPYLNSLIAQGMLLTNYYGVAHPSQPNYIALFSGSTQGITTNGTFPQFPATVPTLASTLAASGYTFGGYAETTADPERQPWIHFANSANDAQNFSAFPQAAAGFANLPTVSYITPNDADNMTPTSDNGGGIPAGDAWVQANLSAYAAWAQANNSLLIVAFDENNTNPAVTYPDHVAAIAVGGGVPAGVLNDSPADPYSLLATIESLYGAAPIGASAGVPALNFYSSTPARATTSVTRSFSGLSDPTKNPPQNALAVGLNSIFTAETTHYETTDLNGNPIISNGSLYSLFAPLGSTLENNLRDARAAYDSSTGRYVVIADNFQPGGGNFATNINIAVSVDSNPSDGWYFASIDTSNGATTQSVLPYLSVNNGKIYISTPEFLDAGGGYSSGEFVVNESSVIAAGNRAITADASASVPGTGGIMRNIAGDNGVTYYLSAYSTVRETAVVYQTYDPTHGFSGTQTLFLGDADVGGGGSDYTAAQLGTTKTLDIGDGRIQSLAYTSSGGRNYVYGVSEAMPSAGSLAQIEWFKLDVTDPTNPQYVIGNVISGASIGTGVAVFNPSIAVDRNGDVLINFSASGPNMYPSDYYMVLGAGASAFSAPTLYQASTTYFDSGSLNDQRWGTYSTAIADPNNPNGFWISNEYVANGWWQTAVTQIAVQATAPTVSSIVTSGSGVTSGAGDLNAGQVVTLTVNFSAAVTVNTSGGSPTLALNDGGTATYTGGSGSTALTFSYTVAAGQNTPDLVVSSFNLNGATVKDGAGNVANLSGATNYNPAGTLQIDTAAPLVSSIVASGTGIASGSGDLGIGQVVTLTVNFSEPVTVNTGGGTPTLALNDGGTAAYTGGSGSTALTFSYTVAAGQNTPDLVVSSFNLNGATVKDGAGNNADLSGATNYNPAGTLQIDTLAPTVSSIVASGSGITNGAGDLNAGKVVTLTVNFSSAVTVNTSGGSPTLTLNDGGSATYSGGSGSTALTFSYTVAAGQNTPDLVVSSFNLNGATVKDGSGNAANLSGATNYTPAGTLQIDTAAPVPTFSQEPPSSTPSSTAVFSFTTSNAETGGVSYAYELDGASTWTPVSGNSLSLSGLANGSHAIQVQATDGAGNVSASPASYSWTVAPGAAQIETLFSGPSSTSTYPPHNGLAIGPNNVLMVEGSQIEWTNLTGGSPTLKSIYSFFSSLSPTGGLYDQRCAYDSANQRYVVIMQYLASGGAVSDIYIAVSKDSNPNDGWYFSQLNTAITINGQLTDSDRPTMSIDGSNVYITAPQYSANASSYAGTESWVIGKTAGPGGGLYNGGTPTVTANQLTPSSQGIFAVAAGNNGKTYYACDNSSGGQIVVTLQTYDTATNTFGATSTINLGTIDQGGSYTAQQLGTTLLLDAVDRRIASMNYANGFLYGVAEMKPNGSSVPLVHWFKIDVSNPNAPTLAAQGDISGAAIGTSVATFNPSIAVDASGDVLINFTASGPNMYPGDYYVYQKGSDPAGSFSAPIVFQASTGYFNSGNGSSVQRWGLNSSAAVDPNNPTSFWISNEYVANNWWQTSVARVAIESAETPTLSIASTSLNVTAGSSVALGITATPVDSDDTISVTIAGVPTYESITAPSGDTVTSSLQTDGTKTWTIAESASATGTPLTGLTLFSNYTGQDHPVASLTVTASNTTSGESATSAPQTMTVTDPPAITSDSQNWPTGLTVASSQGSGNFDHASALLAQFAATEFQGDQSAAGQSVSNSTAGDQEPAFLAAPHGQQQATHF